MLRPDRRAERLALRAVLLVANEFPDALLPEGEAALARVGEEMAEALAQAAWRLGIAAEDVAEALGRYLR